MTWALLMATVFSPLSDGRPLDRYLARPEPDFAWKKAGSDALRLTSLSWQGNKWEHDLVIRRPKRPAGLDTVVLHVTGGKPNPADLDGAQRLADLSGLTVATLFQIPNQPLFGRTEDDLIAYTFERYLETGDVDWPLLFPMAKSAFAAMRALAESERKSLKFVVTGASKRGWTSWLAAATGDPRVAGIMPVVFDNLKFREQLAKQLADWGRYSPMIADYTDRGLQDMLGSDRGRELLAMMDPAAYLPRLKAPLLMLHGGNDRYWTVDALGLYWDAIPTPRAVVVVPNQGHGLGSPEFWIPTMAEFARRAAQGESLPQVTDGADVDDDGQTLVTLSLPQGTPVERVTAWVASSETRDFSEAKWVERPADALRGSSAPSWVYTARSGAMNQAVVLVAEIKGETGTYRLTTPARVVEAQSQRR